MQELLWSSTELGGGKAEPELAKVLRKFHTQEVSHSALSRKGSCPCRHTLKHTPLCALLVFLFPQTLNTSKQQTAKQVLNSEWELHPSGWQSPADAHLGWMDSQLPWECFTFLFLENPGNSELGFCWCPVLNTSLDLCSACAVPAQSLSRLGRFSGLCWSGGSLKAELWVETRNKVRKSLNENNSAFKFQFPGFNFEFSVTLNLWVSAPSHCPPTPLIYFQYHQPNFSNSLHCLGSVLNQCQPRQCISVAGFFFCKLQEGQLPLCCPFIQFVIDNIPGNTLSRRRIWFAVCSKPQLVYLLSSF